VALACLVQPLVVQVKAPVLALLLALAARTGCQMLVPLNINS
jgi:hypothetical protein